MFERLTDGSAQLPMTRLMELFTRYSSWTLRPCRRPGRFPHRTLSGLEATVSGQNHIFDPKQVALHLSGFLDRVGA